MQQITLTDTSLVIFAVLFQKMMVIAVICGDNARRGVEFFFLNFNIDWVACVVTCVWFTTIVTIFSIDIILIFLTVRCCVLVPTNKTNTWQIVDIYGSSCFPNKRNCLHYKVISHTSQSNITNITFHYRSLICDDIPTTPLIIFGNRYCQITRVIFTLHLAQHNMHDTQ